MSSTDKLCMCEAEAQFSYERIFFFIAEDLRKKIWILLIYSYLFNILNYVKL